MSPDQFQDTLATVYTFLKNNQPEQAWIALEDTKFTSYRLHPDVIRLRLLALAELKNWEVGMDLLEFVMPADPLPCRSAAGAFLLAHAEEMCRRGDYEAARRSVGQFQTIYPEGHPQLAEISELLALRP